MDYRALLTKYMRHVCDEEGITFTDWLPPRDFTYGEVLALREIAAEIGAEATDAR